MSARRITVHVEDAELRLWAWARVKHAVIGHDPAAWRRVREGEILVVDAAGHRVDPEGHVEPGARFYLRPARG